MGPERKNGRPMAATDSPQAQGFNLLRLIIRSSLLSSLRPVPGEG
jgi:hypothetical protein